MTIFFYQLYAYKFIFISLFIFVHICSDFVPFHKFRVYSFLTLLKTFGCLLLFMGERIVTCGAFFTNTYRYLQCYFHATLFFFNRYRAAAKCFVQKV
jgi:hypothetical protein